VLFFAAMIPLVACFRLAAHNGAWLAKILFVHLIFIASCWMSDESMAKFASVSLLGSGVFIAMQVLALLDWSYTWNESWRAKAEEDEGYFANLLWATIACYTASIIVIVFTIVQFAAAGCSLAIAEVTCTVIACALFSVLSVVGIADHGSLLCSAVVTLYVCFYCWSGLSGMAGDIKDDSGAACNSLLGTDGNGATAVNVLMGLVLTVLGLAWSVWSTSGTAVGGGDNSDGAATEGSYMGLTGGESDNSGEDAGDPSLIQPLVTYHSLMVLVTMFACMVVVNWDAGNTMSTATTLGDYGTGDTVVAVKLIAQWFTVAMYIWTIVAQRCLGLCGVQREFEFNA